MSCSSHQAVQTGARCCEVCSGTGRICRCKNRPVRGSINGSAWNPCVGSAVLLQRSVIAPTLNACLFFFCFKLLWRIFALNFLCSELVSWHRVSSFSVGRALSLVSSGAAMQPGFKEEFCLLRPWGQDPGSVLTVAVICCGGCAGTAC